MAFAAKLWSLDDVDSPDDPGFLVGRLEVPMPPNSGAGEIVDDVDWPDNLGFCGIASALNQFSSSNGTLGGTMSHWWESDFLFDGKFSVISISSMKLTTIS